MYFHHCVPHLMLLDKDGPDLGCNHGDNGGDVVLESVGEAASPGDAVLVEVRHVLSHAFHLFTCESDKNKGGALIESKSEVNNLSRKQTGAKSTLPALIFHSNHKKEAFIHSFKYASCGEAIDKRNINK